MPQSQLRPIDNCPHDFEWDDVAQEEYCKHCGFVPKQESGGWNDAFEDNS